MKQLKRYEKKKLNEPSPTRNHVNSGDQKEYRMYTAHSAVLLLHVCETPTTPSDLLLLEERQQTQHYLPLSVPGDGCSAQLLQYYGVSFDGVGSRGAGLTLATLSLTLLAFSGLFALLLNHEKSTLMHFRLFIVGYSTLESWPEENPGCRISACSYGRCVPETWPPRA